MLKRQRSRDKNGHNQFRISHTNGESLEWGDVFDVERGTRLVPDAREGGEYSAGNSRQKNEAIPAV